MVEGRRGKRNEAIVFMKGFFQGYNVIISFLLPFLPLGLTQIHDLLNCACMRARVYECVCVCACLCLFLNI